MADQATVHIGENSPEHVALRLLMTIASNEGKKIYGGPTSGGSYADKEWLLTNYKDCLKAVRDPY
jgi:hypothetical protein